jgi:hypothetical protein
LEIIEFADFLGKFDNDHIKQQRFEANPHWDPIGFVYFYLPIKESLPFGDV